LRWRGPAATEPSGGGAERANPKERTEAAIPADPLLSEDEKEACSRSTGARCSRTTNGLGVGSRGSRAGPRGSLAKSASARPGPRRSTGEH
jgi:hypothetical protein